MILPPGQGREDMQAGQQASPTAKKKSCRVPKGYIWCIGSGGGGGEWLLNPLRGMSRHVLRRAVTEEK